MTTTTASHHRTEIEHYYGHNVHLLDDPLALTLLSELCADRTVQPQINRLVAALYQGLVSTVIRREMPTRDIAVPTRMATQEPKAIWRGRIVDPHIKAAVVCVARAGIFPSQVCFDFLNQILDPAGVRQDHMLMNRTTDGEGQVKGAAIHGAKIGGPVDGTTLMIPDPMGATGSTTLALLDHYHEHVAGTPAKVITLNLIVTPEYIRRVFAQRPDTIIYAYRLDRGLSDEDVLQAPPGKYWDRERGLSDKGYIIPGGGGFGEVMNNAFV